MASFVFDKVKERIAKGEINFDGNENLKLALVDESFWSVAALKNQEKWVTGGIKGFEIHEEGGYTGAVDLENVVVEFNQATQYEYNAYVKCDDVTFGTNTTISARGAVVYEDDEEDDGNLICAIDFGGNVSSSNGVYEINFDWYKGFLKLS